MLTSADLHAWVKDLPIIDWHNHLDFQMLADDRPLGSLYEVWVKADPYKHRAMRICGEGEELITGERSDGQDARRPSADVILGGPFPGPTGVPPVGDEAPQWAAWMRTLPKLVGNPLFTWAKMELELLGLDPEPYLHGRGENVLLSNWTPSKLLRAFGVEMICPCLSAEQLALQAMGRRASRPSGRDCPFPHADGQDARRPGDGAADGQDARRPGRNAFSTVPSLRMNAGEWIPNETLERFEAAGCRVVDISVDDTAKLETEFESLAFVAAFAAAHGWTMLLHLGALRETSARLRSVAGPAGGFAGMRAPADPTAVARFLNRLESGEVGVPCTGPTGVPPDGERSFASISDGQDAHRPGDGAADGQDARRPDARRPSENHFSSALPRTILLSLNPEAHAQLAVLAGSFNGAGMPGKVQLGPAWWWCDHEEGIRDILEKNAAYGVLTTFVGMTTDSRSLLSFVRHDYFRRIICKWTAEKIATGAFPDDESLIRPILENICYRNARDMIAGIKQSNNQTVHP